MYVVTGRVSAYVRPGVSKTTSCFIVLEHSDGKLQYDKVSVNQTGPATGADRRVLTLNAVFATPPPPYEQLFALELQCAAGGDTTALDPDNFWGQAFLSAHTVPLIEGASGWPVSVP